MVPSGLLARIFVAEDTVTSRSTGQRASNRLSLTHWTRQKILQEGRSTAPAPLTQRDLIARKVVNRKALREEAEAAERSPELKKKKKKATKRKAAKRKSRSKAAAEVRIKLFWGVYNQSMKPVAIFEYDQKEAAEKKAEALSQSGKSPHFVQKVKQAIDTEA